MILGVSSQCKCIDSMVGNIRVSVREVYVKHRTPVIVHHAEHCTL